MFFHVLELTKAEVKVTVLIVFTKYDTLFNECYRKASKGANRRLDAEMKAENSLNSLINGFQRPIGEYVTVSTHVQYPSLSDTSYHRLTGLLTRPAL